MLSEIPVGGSDQAEVSNQSSIRNGLYSTTAAHLDLDELVSTDRLSGFYDSSSIAHYDLPDVDYHYHHENPIKWTLTASELANVTSISDPPECQTPMSTLESSNCTVTIRDSPIVESKATTEGLVLPDKKLLQARESQNCHGDSQFGQIPGCEPMLRPFICKGRTLRNTRKDNMDSLMKEVPENDAEFHYAPHKDNSAGDVEDGGSASTPPKQKNLKRIEPKPEQEKQVDGTVVHSAIMEKLKNVRDSRDAFLIRLRLEGKSYKEIRRLGNFTEAESTLRGRFRTLVKPRKARVRRPEWKDTDVRV